MNECMQHRLGCVQKRSFRDQKEFHSMVVACQQRRVGAFVFDMVPVRFPQPLVGWVCVCVGGGLMRVETTC